VGQPGDTFLLDCRRRLRHALQRTVEDRARTAEIEAHVAGIHIAKAEIGLQLMRYGALRMLSNTDHAKIDGAALTYKIQWASWRRSLGELAMDVLGQGAEVTDGAEYEWDVLPNLFLYSRSDTIYGGTNQIQRNLIAERGLGMPREPRGDI